MNQWKWVSLIAVLLLGTSAVPAGCHSLYGMVVVIDAGHGGSDPGAHGTFPNNGHTVEVVEDEYVADVARRLTRMARAYGAIVVNTTYDPQQPRPIALPSHQVIPPDRTERYRGGGRVNASVSGLQRRVAIANQTLRQYPRHRVVFLSIHFDATGNRSLEGAHLIGPNTGITEIANLLAEEFRKEGRIRTLRGREHCPVVRSGDKAHGVRNLYVLRDSKNRVRQRVLVELGNFSNPDDVWRIRNYEIREQYAQIMLRALLQLNRLPLRVCRSP